MLGAKGSGKTKWLMDKANEEMKRGNGNIIFIDVDDNHIFSLGLFRKTCKCHRVQY